MRGWWYSDAEGGAVMPIINLQTIANSGQCFRMKKVRETSEYQEWDICAKDKRVLAIQFMETGNIDLQCDVDEAAFFWRPYFDIATDYQSIYDKINTSDDEFLKSALAYSGGMRILRQDFWETLVSFLISQNNNIPRIKQTIKDLCLTFGKWSEETGYGFPTKEILDKRVTKFSDLDCLGLGYRQEYLYRLIKCDSSAIVPEYDKLLSLRGVGPKVASCVLLYGAHDMTQFPIDAWMRKLIDDVYGGHFDVEPYREWAGFVQQIMFYYYRHLKGVK